MNLNYQADWPKDNPKGWYRSKERAEVWAGIVLAVVVGVFINLTF